VEAHHPVIDGSLADAQLLAHLGQRLTLYDVQPAKKGLNRFATLKFNQPHRRSLAPSHVVTSLANQSVPDARSRCQGDFCVGIKFFCGVKIEREMKLQGPDTIEEWYTIGG